MTKRIKVMVKFTGRQEPEVLEIPENELDGMRIGFNQKNQGVFTVQDFAWNPERPRRIDINLRNVTTITEMM